MRMDWIAASSIQLPCSSQTRKKHAVLQFSAHAETFNLAQGQKVIGAAIIAILHWMLKIKPPSIET